MACCPVASVVLNFAELLGKGRRTLQIFAGTMLCIVTMPVMLLIL
ncbi:MAG: hypothetical protein ACLRSW_14065 [Christensenellaceae bacterium]